MFLYTKFHTWLKTRSVQVSKNKTHRILAFDRETFEKDLKELHRRTELEIIYFPMFVYGAFFTAFMPRYMKDQLRYHIYNSPKELELKDKFQTVCDRVFPFFQGYLKFNGVISANIDYPYDQAWIDAARKYNVPFISLIKEGVQSDAHFEWWVRHFSDPPFKFNGRKMTVFCDRRKETLLKAGVVGADGIVVVGAPRTDSIYDALSKKYKSDDHQGPLAALFTFGYAANKRQVLWGNTLTAFARSASKLSENGSIEFMIKYRLDSDRIEIENTLSRENLKDSVHLSNSITFSELARRCVLAVGYNTTAIIEMMATEVPIIVPHFAEALYDPSENMLDVDRYSPAYFVAKSPDELEEMIGVVIQGRSITYSPEMRRARDKVIEKFVYRIDGKRSDAVASIIKDAIASLS